MKGWVGLDGWHIADGLTTQVVTHQLQVERRTAKVRWWQTDVLPLVVIYILATSTVSHVNDGDGEYLSKTCHVIRLCKWRAPSLWEHCAFNVTQLCRQTGCGMQVVQQCLGVLLSQRQHTLTSASHHQFTYTDKHVWRYWHCINLF